MGQNSCKYDKIHDISKKKLRLRDLSLLGLSLGVHGVLDPQEDKIIRSFSHKSKENTRYGMQTKVNKTELLRQTHFHEDIAKWERKRKKTNEWDITGTEKVFHGEKIFKS